MYSFSEDEFVAQVKASKIAGEPTIELQDMMEEMIIVESRYDKLTADDKNKMIESSICDFESGGLLERLVKNAKLDLGHVFEFFHSSIRCTFSRFKIKLKIKIKLNREKSDE